MSEETRRIEETVEAWAHARQVALAACYVPPLNRLSRLRNPTVRQDFGWNIPL
jgi:hypothetical protein